MAQAIVIESFGGPDVMKLREVDIGVPGPGQVRLRQTRIGVNFHDVYVRTGQHRSLSLPGTPGIEAVGVVEETGPGVVNVKEGDRVAYVTRRYGVYASHRLIDAGILIPLPDTISDNVAASLMLRGLTTEMLMNQIYPITSQSVVLIQAAAGGMGQLLSQWAAHQGALVIGAVGSDENALLARAAGCQHTIHYHRQDVAVEIRKITDGRGVDVVYDGVGKDTFRGSLDSLALLGHLISYGQASGPVKDFEIGDLAEKSLTVTRPRVFHYTDDDKRRERMADVVFRALDEGWLSVKPPREFALKDAPESHRAIETGGARTPILLVP